MLTGYNDWKKQDRERRVEYLNNFIIGALTAWTSHNTMTQSCWVRELDNSKPE